MNARAQAMRSGQLDDDNVSDVDSTYRGFMDDDAESQGDNRRITCFVNNDAMNAYNDDMSDDGGYVKRKGSNDYSDDENAPKRGYLNNKQRRDTTYDY